MGNMNDGSFGPIDLGMWAPGWEERIAKGMQEINAHIQQEWQSISWWKKIIIHLFPSLYPEWS